MKLKDAPVTLLFLRQTPALSAPVRARRRAVFRLSPVRGALLLTTTGAAIAAHSARRDACTAERAIPAAILTRPQAHRRMTPRTRTDPPHSGESVGAVRAGSRTKPAPT